MVDEIHYEIFDICGTEADSIQLLVHIEPSPDHEEYNRAAIVRLSAKTLVVEYVLNTWATSFWQSPTGAIYVASTNGNIHSNPTDRWLYTPVGEQFTLNNIWGLSDELIYCSAFNGNLFRKSLDGWQHFSDGLEGTLCAIGGTSEDDLYVLGVRGALFHHNGKKWSEVQTPTNNTLVSVLSVSREETYFCGWSGAFFRLVKGVWENYSIDPNLSLYSLVLYNSQIFVGAAFDGIFLYDGKKLVSFADDILATGLRVVGGYLFAFGDNIIQRYDGRTWTRMELDLGTVIPQML